MSALEVTLPEAPLDAERLAGLVFELASQLHVERARRIALELALERAGALPAGAAEALAADDEYRRRAGEGLDEAMRRLMRVLAESDDPRTPLRHEASGRRS